MCAMTRSAVRLMCYCVCVFFCVLVEQPPPPPPHTCACALAVCGGLAVCELGLPSPLNLAHICVLPSLVRSKGKTTPHFTLPSQVPTHNPAHQVHARVCGEEGDAAVLYAYTSSHVCGQSGRSWPPQHRPCLAHTLHACTTTRWPLCCHLQ